MVGVLVVWVTMACWPVCIASPSLRRFVHSGLESLHLGPVTAVAYASSSQASLPLLLPCGCRDRSWFGDLCPMLLLPHLSMSWGAVGGEVGPVLLWAFLPTQWASSFG